VDVPIGLRAVYFSQLVWCRSSACLQRVIVGFSQGQLSMSGALLMRRRRNSFGPSKLQEG